MTSQAPAQVSRLGGRFFMLAIVAALIAAVVTLQDQALSQRAKFSSDEDILYLPRASALRALSLGHRELAADLVFIRGLIYFGSEMARSKATGEKTEHYKWLENYLETIVALDPLWKTPYRWAGVATMYDGRAITNPSVKRSNHFLEMGVQRFPSDWELPFMLGCNYLFELHTEDAAERATWRRQGAEWIRHAALVGGGPPWVPLLAATIMREEGQDEAAVRHLEEVYISTSDEKTRIEVRNRLLSLKSKVDVERAEHQRKEFEDAWHKTLPYAPADLFVITGARRPPRLDLEYLARDPVLDAQE